MVINEAMVNPYGSDAGREWVELYNASDAPVSLTGWDLRWALSSSTTGEHELASVVLEPGEFYVISGELVGGGDGGRVELRQRLARTPTSSNS